jgi:hypothetical protein
VLRKHVVLSLLGLLAGTSVLASTNPATQVDAAKLSASPAQTLPISAGMDRASTLGGKLSISWNDDLLHDLGLNRVGAQFGKVNQDRALRHFELGADSALAVDAVDLNVRGLAGGSGHLLATEEFMAGGKRIEWRNARMVVRPGEAPRIDLVSRDGETLFYVDRFMTESPHQHPQRRSASPGEEDAECRCRRPGGGRIQVAGTGPELGRRQGHSRFRRPVLAGHGGDRQSSQRARPTCS